MWYLSIRARADVILDWRDENNTPYMGPRTCSRCCCCTVLPPLLLGPARIDEVPERAVSSAIDSKSLVAADSPLIGTFHEGGPCMLTSCWTCWAFRACKLLTTTTTTTRLL